MLTKMVGSRRRRRKASVLIDHAQVLGPDLGVDLGLPYGTHLAHEGGILKENRLWRAEPPYHVFKE